MDINISIEQINSQRKRDIEAIAKQNDITTQYGLKLSENQIQNIIEHRFTMLKETNRVEFGEGIILKLIDAFYDSPYINQDNYEDTLNELQTVFYFFKNEALERLPDDDLIDAMKTVFNGKAQGSIEYLAGTAMENLCRSYRDGIVEITDFSEGDDIPDE